MAAAGNGAPMAQETDDWIGAARRGDTEALGQALEPFRDYLNLMASRGIGPGLATKAGASDVVQETFLAAQRGIAGFRGSTQAEWRAWLEAILTNQLANLRRSFLDTQKRRAEVAVAPECIPGMNGLLIDTITTPSRQPRASGSGPRDRGGAAPPPRALPPGRPAASRRGTDLRGDRIPDRDLGRRQSGSCGDGPWCA